MATASLLALLDDITTLLDDVSVMSQMAAKKTAGVLGDDLALNAQQVSGISAQRELPVVWAVAKGSLLNKLILVPTALLISSFLPALLLPLLMIGGAFLCFEGAEKVWHSLTHHHRVAGAPAQAGTVATIDPVTAEADKIRGAIRTDFILSAEIIVIALSVVGQADWLQRLLVLSSIALLMTVGVYGLVALIVKLDDMGLWLMQRTGAQYGAQLLRKLGWGMVQGVPYLMRLLSIVGTAAMFLVGGSILAHGLPGIDTLSAALSPLGWLGMLLLHAGVGAAVGGLCLAVWTLGLKRLNRG